MKIILRIFFAVLCVLWFAPGAGLANSSGYSHDEAVYAVTGMVTKVNLAINRLYVVDELTGEKFDFFVHDNELKELKAGEIVRVYFYSTRLPALSVQRLSPPAGKRQEKNKGYLYRKK